MKTLFDPVSYFLKNRKKQSVIPNDLEQQTTEVAFQLPKELNTSIQIVKNKSHDAFEFNFLNNHLYIGINRSHPFYEKVYLKSSKEQKQIIDFFIISMCQMTCDTTNEKVQERDIKYVSRLSEFLEDKLASMNFE
ncbi:hypothetical protein KKI34_16140 [Pseudoalteromonas tetraodonis]|uniref:hypothetical protein n=1 Tax=Pseudoalteromonas tetraodonis TaxID=43659 RepID=UPI001BDEAC67|nr:hypothetical protein [Pseudoalteromonas tetraodonis]MBT2153259.1 hypothetical protein [Pseudoalteromonas tetraodonis]